MMQSATYQKTYRKDFHVSDKNKIYWKDKDIVLQQFLNGIPKSTAISDDYISYMFCSIFKIHTDDNTISTNQKSCINYLLANESKYFSKPITRGQIKIWYSLFFLQNNKYPDSFNHFCKWIQTQKQRQQEPIRSFESNFFKDLKGCKSYFDSIHEKNDVCFMGTTHYRGVNFEKSKFFSKTDNAAEMILNAADDQPFIPIAQPIYIAEHYPPIHKGIPMLKIQSPTFDPSKEIVITSEASQGAIDLIKKCEGFRAQAYKDSAGILTIGIGIAREYPDGTPIKEDDTCTEEQAVQWLREHLEKHVFPAVEHVCRGQDIPKEIVESLCSFAYNVGVKPLTFCGSVLMSLLDHKWEDLAKAMGTFNKITVDGKLEVCEGLVNRRKIEVDNFKDLLTI